MDLLNPLKNIVIRGAAHIPREEYYKRFTLQGGGVCIRVEIKMRLSSVFILKDFSSESRRTDRALQNKHYFEVGSRKEVVGSIGLQVVLERLCNPRIT